MKEDNHYYGHAQVLARYVGLDAAPPIWGIVQHGWNPATGFPARYPLGGRVRKFVWNDSNRAMAISSGGRSIHAIGAPFVYAVADLTRVKVSGPTRSTIAYPYHSAPGRPVDAHAGRWARLLQAREDGDVTVCLYWMDFEQASVRRSYEELGFRVICHGRRDDCTFLSNQLTELLQHRRVVSNRVATAMFYGAYLGLDVEVYGKVPGADGEDEALAFEAEQRRRWPELVDGGLSGSASVALGSVELGAEYRRDPSELMELLGWSRLRRSLGGPAVRALRVRARVKAAMPHGFYLGPENLSAVAPRTALYFVGPPESCWWTDAHRLVEASTRDGRVERAVIWGKGTGDLGISQWRLRVQDVVYAIVRALIRMPLRTIRAYLAASRTARWRTPVAPLAGVATAMFLAEVDELYAVKGSPGALAAHVHASIHGSSRPGQELHVLERADLLRPGRHTTEKKRC